MNTHSVTNQSPIFEDINLFELDKPLQTILHHYDANWDTKAISDYGQILGSSEWIRE